MKTLAIAAILATGPLAAGDSFLDTHLLIEKTKNRKALSDEERDKLFREAQFAIIKYRHHLAEADFWIEYLLDDMEAKAWDAALKIASEALLVPGDVYTKGIAILITLCHDCIDLKAYAREWESLEYAQKADDHLARAAAWYEKYNQCQNRLLMDEHPKSKQITKQELE